MAIKRLRTKWTPIQRETLEKAYSVEKTPSEATKEELCKQLELGYEQVTVWFMNRRAKDRRHGLVAKKSRMTRHQLATLEKTYACEKNPTAARREEVGKKVGLSEMQVRLWYNKKRFGDQGKERKKRGPVAKKAVLKPAALALSCDHLAFVAADLTDIPCPDTPCKSYTRCHNPNENWCCLCCKDVFCSVDLKSGHLFQHFKQTDHCLALSCSDKSIWCYSCNSFLDAQAIPQLNVFSSSSNASAEPSSSSRLLTPDASKDSSASSRLENLDALMVDVSDLISKPSPYPNFHPLQITLFVDEDKLAIAKKGLQKIFDCGFDSLADPHVQEEFLAYSAIVLSSVYSCPSGLKAILSSFRDNISVETSAYVQAQHELKVASNLSASITEKKFVLRYHHSKYAEVKKQIIASDEKVTNLKAMIKRLETSLAEELSNREKIDQVLDSIETGVEDAREGLLSDIEQVSAMEGATKAANQLVAQRNSAWKNLKHIFTEVYCNLHVGGQQAEPTS